MRGKVSVARLEFTIYFPAVNPATPVRFQRLAILGAWAPHRDEDAYARAARRLGVDARVYDVLHWTQRIKGLAPPLIDRAVRRFDPDIILCTRDAARLGRDRLARLFRNRTAVFWHVDPVAQEGVIELARLCGTLYTTYAAQRDRYRAAGIPVVRFLPQAMDRDRDVPATRTRSEYICDASFVGSGPYPHRWPVLAAVGRTCRLQVRGPGWTGVRVPFLVAGGAVHGAKYAQVIASAAVSLGANALPEQAGDYASASNRMWKIFGCRGAYVGAHVEGIEQFALAGEHCLWFHDVDQCVT
ncbi:MAG: glycosyltransferase family protein, partial [Gemmatimonadales bacterium]